MSLIFLNRLTRNGLVNFRSVFLLSKSMESCILRQVLISRKYAARGTQESSSSSESSSSDDSSSSDEEDNNKKSVASEKMRGSTSNEKTHNTLNSLLLSLAQTKKEDVSGPEEKKAEITEKLVVPKEFGKIQAAAKGVAESLGGDVKKTESELLNHLMSRKEKRKSDEPRKTTVNLSELIVGMQIDRTPSSPGEAFRRIQRMIGEKPRTSPPRKNLPPTPPTQGPSVTSSLLSEGEGEHERQGPSQVASSARDRDSVTASLLSDRFQERVSVSASSWRSDSTQEKDSVSASSRSDRTQERDSRYVKRRSATTENENSISASLLAEDETPARSFRFQAQGPPTKVDLFGEEPLGIFPVSDDYVEAPTLQTWTYLQEREMRLAVAHPPANYFEEMIQWTEKGMLWKFPIDNEDGIVQEANVPFSDHVFLEKHLVPWCPTKGPIRHFMELVCVGLSKNPHMTVEDKKANILWYKEYFEGKSDLLKSVGITLPTSGQAKITDGDSAN